MNFINNIRGLEKEFYLHNNIEFLIEDIIDAVFKVSDKKTKIALLEILERQLSINSAFNFIHMLKKFDDNKELAYRLINRLIITYEFFNQ